MSKPETWSRRDVIQLAAACGAVPTLGLATEQDNMLTRPIPASGEALPVVGIGTWQVFDIAANPQELEQRATIVDMLLDRGGSVIDTSPMYNRAEDVIGDVMNATGRREECFLATKVWTNGKQSGIEQMERSARLMNTDVIDLMQVHNLRDLDTHFGTLREWREDGRIRYHGITDYRASALDDMEAAMRRYRPDFIQINYSLGEPEADRRVLPLAADMGIAVLANRPYVSGRLFAAVRGHDVPGWAQEFAGSWGQFFLKFILGHPAVNCAIPATSNPRHMADNLGAGFGPLPDDATRARMMRHINELA